MARVAVALAVVVALAAGVWWFWPTGEDPMSGATTSTLAGVTTSTVGTEPSTTRAEAATTIPADITVEEAEEILRNLWFGWFEGIYDQDEERIREVVISEEQVDVARSQFGKMTFGGRPTLAAIAIEEAEILHASDMCLVVWASATASFRAGATVGVHLFHYQDGSWRLFSYWLYRNDLWEDDCGGL